MSRCIACGSKVPPNEQYKHLQTKHNLSKPSQPVETYFSGKTFKQEVAAIEKGKTETKKKERSAVARSLLGRMK